MTQPNEAICRLLGLSTPPSQLSLYSLVGLPAGEADPAKLRAAIQATAQRFRAAAATPNAPADAVAAAGKALQRAQATLLSPEAKARYDEMLLAMSSSAAAQPKPAPGSPIPAAAKPDPTKSAPAKPTPAQPTPAKPTPAQPEATKPLPARAAAKPASAAAPKMDVAPAAELELAERPLRLEDVLPPGDPHRPFDLQAFLQDEGAAEPEREGVQERKDALAALRSGGAVAASGNAVTPRADLASPQISERGQELRQRLRRRRAARNAATVGGLSLVALGLLAYAAYVFINKRDRQDDRLADRGLQPIPAAQGQADPRPVASGFTDPPIGGTGLSEEPNEDLPELPSVSIVDATSEGEVGGEAAVGNDAATMTGEGGPEMRMDRTSQLVRIGEESFAEGYEELEPGSALRLEGGEEVSVVERSEDQFILRRGGKNETHRRAELPLEVLEGILNLSLDPQHPIDVAARGVFLLRYSGDEVYQTAGRKHLATAAADPRFAKLDEAMLKPQ